MSQIFDRIKNIARSYINDFDFVDKPDDLKSQNASEDDELKRIIDELSSDNKSKDTSNENEVSQENTAFDHYKELGLTSSATIDEIKTAYREKINEYHPDKVQNMGKEIKELAQDKTIRINQAYSKIKEEREF